jgi:hypothetical protein
MIIASIRFLVTGDRFLRIETRIRSPTINHFLIHEKELALHSAGVGGVI